MVAWALTPQAAAQTAAGQGPVPPRKAFTSPTGPRWRSLSGVDDRVDRLDAAVGDVEGQHPQEAAVAVGGEQAGVAVDLGRADPHAGDPAAAGQADQEAGDPLGPVDGALRAGALPPPSPWRTASAASRPTRPSVSPRSTAAKKRAASSSHWAAHPSWREGFHVALGAAA